MLQTVADINPMKNTYYLDYYENSSLEKLQSDMQNYQKEIEPAILKMIDTRRLIVIYEKHYRIKTSSKHFWKSCDVDNIASAKTIEKCGGNLEREEPFVYEEDVYYKYWITL